MNKREGTVARSRPSAASDLMRNAESRDRCKVEHWEENTVPRIGVFLWRRRVNVSSTSVMAKFHCLSKAAM